MPYTPPPVIPEIAKAYQNDPRTLIALAASKAGASTEPVARGGYGYADGIARILQGAMGGFAQRKQAEAYSKDQADLLALRKARGVDGLTGTGTSGPAPVAPVPPPAPGSDPTGASLPPQQAQAVAAALGAPAPVAAPSGPPPGPPPIPMAPIPPAAGAGPGPRPPFGPSAASAPPGPFAFTPEAVPAAPAPVARPVAPAAVGPTTSNTLKAAYKIMTDANPYESAGGQDMYNTGLAEQTKLDESATERKQKVSDMGYQSDLSTFASASEQDRNAAIQARAAAEARNAAGITKIGDRLFEHGENGLKLASEEKRSALERATQIRVAEIKEAGDNARAAASSSALTPEEQDAINKATGDKRLDLMRVNTRNRKSIAQALIANPGLNAIQLSALSAGMSAEGRAAGSRVGATDVATSEVPVLAAEAKVRHSQLKAQGNFVPWNAAVQMVQSGTSSPELTRVMAINSAVTNAYARSFGTGALSVAAQKKAEGQLQRTWGTPGYDAALDQIVANTKMERQGAQGALSAIGGTGGTGGTAAPASGNVVQRNPGETVAQYLKRKGD